MAEFDPQKSGLSSAKSNGNVNHVIDISEYDLDECWKMPAMHANKAIHETVLKCTRTLIADLCDQVEGGHPGGAMGMAAIGICLWRYTMRYSPRHPQWFNRDRFVLSNGHCCLLQYIFMHYTGYVDMTLEQLKSYHSDREDSLCPGHPEIDHAGIEVSTGPLGQGIANAVGLAVAEKHLASIYNQKGYQIIDNSIWCSVGDTCLQEGVALEAMSLAGQWKLDNLIVIYDNNQISHDGPVCLANSEDINQKIAASNWHVIEVENGSFDCGRLLEAFEEAKAVKDKPIFINVQTVIGTDTHVAGKRKAHGTPLGPDEVKKLKIRYGLDPDLSFQIAKEVYDFFEPVPTRGERLYADWQQKFQQYIKHFPELGTQLQKRIDGKLDIDDAWLSNQDYPSTPMSGTMSAKLALHPTFLQSPSIMVGTADLGSSVKLEYDGRQDFQSPDLPLSLELKGSYSGRYVHYGTREHAMAAISNGLAAYNPGTIIPVTSTFLMFTLYAAAAIRMSALQALQVIHIATHDSITIGEDGPTHQPIEVAALYRAMPNMLYIRPCDTEELAGAWLAALQARKTPSVISISSKPVLQYPASTSRTGVLKGAYTLFEDENAAVSLLGTGSELGFAVQTQILLRQRGIKARVVSFPCQRLFEQQPREYKRDVLRRVRGIPAVVIEAYSSNGWERYADAGVCMSSFGKSLPPRKLQRFFGFDETLIAPKVIRFLEDWKTGGIKGEFQEL